MSNTNANAVQAGGGIGVCSGLGIAFTVLKLMNFITWSWWWVLAPFWAPAALTIVVIGVILFIALAADSK